MDPGARKFRAWVEMTLNFRDIFHLLVCASSCGSANPLNPFPLHGPGRPSCTRHGVAQV